MKRNDRNDVPQLSMAINSRKICADGALVEVRILLNSRRQHKQ